MGQSFNKQQYEPESINFLPLRNMCDVGKSVINVKGLPSGSASPSGQWIIDFASGTKYGNYNVKKGFLKWWLKPELVIEMSKNINVEVLPGENVIEDIEITNIKGLDYETQLYSKVVHPLIVNHICPNFVKFLASGETCSKEDLLNTLINKTEDDLTGGKIQDYELRSNMDRNISWVYWQLKNRPSIGTYYDPSVDGTWETYLTKEFNESKEPETPALKSQLNITNKTPSGGEFNFFVTEAATESIDLITWIEQMKNNGTISNSEFAIVLFQIVYACYSMNLSKMVHNDLHAGNIWVKDIGQETEVIYVIQNGTYCMKTRWKVMVYDFDFSHCEWNGVNEKVDRDWVKEYNISNYNKDAQIKDVAKVFSYVYSSIKANNQLGNGLIGIISKSQYNKEIVKLYEDDAGGYLGITDQNGDVTPFSNWSYFHNHETILKNISSATQNISVSTSWASVYSTRYMSKLIARNPPLNKHENIFFCAPSFFNKNGTLNYTTINEKFKAVVEAYKYI